MGKIVVKAGYEEVVAKLEEKKLHIREEIEEKYKSEVAIIDEALSLFYEEIEEPIVEEEIEEPAVEEPVAEGIEPEYVEPQY